MEDAGVVGFAFGFGQAVQGDGAVHGFGGLLFARGLESGEFGLVAVEGAADAAFVGGEEARDLDWSSQARVGPGMESSGLVAESSGEDAFFDGVGALEAPHAVGDLVDEAGFDGAGGLVVLHDGGVVFVPGGGFFGGEDEDLAGESVAEGVEAAAGFAFLGARAGGAGFWESAAIGSVCGVIAVKLLQK